ncbi:MAG TPA: MerR family transcriptional regulator [Steroidobacteraceae bacterium]|nr:MerR family transcriptional regulator [Steroidobacteraceae bacterium]
MRYRIGEFARLGGASIKTLRFYAELGLLVPAATDARTRYRYYDAAQLKDLAAIRALKELGASLEDIRHAISRGAPTERRKLLEKLRHRARRTLDATRRSLDWIELELEDADHGDDPTTVVMQQHGEIRIASIRARLNSYDDIVPLERDLANALRPSIAGDTRGVLWHRCAASGTIEGEPFVELKGRAPRLGGYELKALPGARVATAWCEADDSAAIRAYDAIDRWIHRHALRLDGPKREIYRGRILEIQFPVRTF